MIVEMEDVISGRSAEMAKIKSNLSLSIRRALRGGSLATESILYSEHCSWMGCSEKELDEFIERVMSRSVQRDGLAWSLIGAKP